MHIGVIGSGNFSIKVFNSLKKMNGISIIGGYESIQASNFKTFKTLDDLLISVDIVLVLDMLSCNYVTLSTILKQSKHLYIESPGLLSRRDLSRLELLSQEARVVLQIGLKQRFYNFYDDLEKHDVLPRMIDARRHIKFNINTTQLSVVDDLMQHDIDVILGLVNSDVKSINSNAVGVYYKDPDIVNCRIEFYNGCVANISASKIADTDIHSTELFQNNFHCVINFLDQYVQVQSSQSHVGDLKKDWGVRSNYNHGKDDYIFMLTKEIQALQHSILNNIEPFAGISQYLQLQSVTGKIKEQLERNFTANV